MVQTAPLLHSKKLRSFSHWAKFSVPHDDLKLNLLDLSRKKMEKVLSQMGENPARSQQVFKWIHQVGLLDFTRMTGFSRSFRQKLVEETTILLPEIVLEQESLDGTHKWLIRLADGNCIETVFIPERNRGTLCISSQVGCALNCSFCSTGKQGFNRNLKVSEIIGQLWLACRRLSQDKITQNRVITNVVLMGMGEPLLNFTNVVDAMEIMLDDFAYNLSKNRVTLSTSGLIPQMLRLKEISRAQLAVSLHAPNDELRNQLVPINKKYSLDPLMMVCKHYYEKEPKRSIMFEYVMLDDVNDRKQHADELIQLFQRYEMSSCKINLIPFNAFPYSAYRKSKLETILRFQQILATAKLRTTIRKTRADDIEAACGQLRGRFQDKIRRRTTSMYLDGE
jgi:23S rRNA (adenine2503-C2)-methyltransferase